mgnify:CR=1 FL=1
MARKKATDLTFQQHIAGFLARAHGDSVLNRSVKNQPLDQSHQVS